MTTRIRRQYQRILTLVLSAVILASVMFSATLNINAAGQFDFNDLLVQLTMKDGNAEVGSIDPVTAKEYNFNLMISPNVDALEKAPDDLDDVVLKVEMPKGTKVKEEFFNITIKRGKNNAGEDVESKIVAEIDKNEDTDTLILTINNIFLWKYLDKVSGGLVVVNYGFKASNIFPDFTTPEGATDNIKVTYQGRVLDQRQVVSAPRELTWKSTPSVSSNYTEIKASVEYDIEETTAVMVDVLMANKNTGIMGVQLKPNTVAGKAPIQATSITGLKQVITVPDKITIDIDSLQTVLNEKAINKDIKPDIDYNSSAKTITITWPEITIDNQQDLNSYILVNTQLPNFKYDADEIFKINGERKIGITHAFSFQSDITATVKGIGNAKQDIPINQTSYTYNARSPFTQVAENFNASNSVSGKVESSDKYSNTYYAIGPVNYKGTFTNPLDYIKNGSTLTNTIHSFENRQILSTSVLNKFKVTQDFTKSYDKQYIHQIVLNPVQDNLNSSLNKAVKVIIDFEDGGQATCSVNLGNDPVTIDLTTAPCMSGKSLLSSDMKGNVKSITYDYGKVNKGFKTIGNKGNQAISHVIPHYIPNPSGQAFVWNLVKENVTNINNIEEIIQYVKSSAGLLNNYTFFRSDVRISYETPEISPEIKTSSRVLTDNIRYFDTTPTLSVNKRIYNITRELEQGFDFSNDDEVEFFLFVTPQGDNLKRPIGHIKVADILLENNIDPNSLGEASWEIYQKEPKVKDIISGKVTPIVSGKDVVGGHKETLPSNLPLTYTEIFKSTKPDENGITTWVPGTNADDEATLNHSWEWFGRLQQGQTFIIRYKGKVKTSDGSGNSLNNTFDSYAAYYYGTYEDIEGDLNGYEEETVLSTGKLQQYVDPRPKYLDIKVMSESEENGQRIKEETVETFTATARVEDFIKKTQPDNTSITMSFILPYGWQWENIDSIKLNKVPYNKNKQPVVTDITNNITPSIEYQNKVVTDNYGNTQTVRSTRVSIKIDNLNLDNEIYYTVDVQFKAKTASSEDVFSKLTGGYKTGNGTSAQYHDRVFATISMYDDEFRNHGWNIYKKYEQNFLVDVNGNPIAPTTLNDGGTKNYYSHRLVYGSIGKAEDNSLEGTDEVGIYGFVNHDKDDTTVNSLSYYSDVVYRQQYYKPRVSITPSQSKVILGTSDVNFKYDVVISNDTSDPIPFYADQIRIRLPEYVDYVGNPVMTFNTGNSALGQTITNLKVQQIKNDDQKSTLQLGYELQVDFDTIKLEPNTSYKLTFDVKVNPTTFGESGGGKDYKVSRLLQGGYAHAALLGIEGSPIPEDYASYNYRENTKYLLFDNETISPFSRTNDNLINSINNLNWWSYGKSNISFERAAIYAGIEKKAYIEASNGTFIEVLDSTTVNTGSNIRWDVVIHNPSLSTKAELQTDIEKATVIDILPTGYRIDEQYANITIKSSKGNDVSGIEYTLDSEKKEITFTNVNVKVDDTLTISYETIVPPSEVDIVVNNVYLVPDSVLTFNPLDVYRGNYLTAEAMKEISGTINQAGIHASKALYYNAGIGVSGVKTQVTKDSISQENNQAALGLGSDVRYQLEVMNTHSSNTFSGLVIIDKLPAIDDTYYDKLNKRGSEFPILFNQPETDFEEIVKVKRLGQDGDEKALAASDYSLRFGNIETVTQQQFNKNYTGTEFDISTQDSIDNFDIYSHNTIRFELLTTLDVGDRIVIEINAHVPTVEEAIALDLEPLSLNNQKAVNNFAFQVDNGASRSRIFNLNSVELKAKVAKVSLNTFLDENLNGYDDEQAFIPAEVSIPVIINEKVTGDVIFSGAVTGDKMVNLYMLDPSKEYIVTFANTDYQQRDYYWMSDVSRIDPQLTSLGNATMIDKFGRYQIVADSFDFGDQYNIYAGYYRTGQRVSGYIWHDEDRDGLIGSNETYVSDVTVVIYRTDEYGVIHPDDVATGLATTTTDNSGLYMFDLVALETATGLDLSDNHFMIKVVLPNAYNRFSEPLKAGPHTGLRQLSQPAEYWMGSYYEGSLANADGEIAVISFPSGYLNAGVYHFEETPLPDTGDKQNTLYWTTAILISWIIIGYVFHENKQSY